MYVTHSKYPIALPIRFILYVAKTKWQLKLLQNKTNKISNMDTRHSFSLFQTLVLVIDLF